MAAVFAFLGMLLISMVVALLAALQLGDFFGASSEFGLVILLVMAFAAVALGAVRRHICVDEKRSTRSPGWRGSWLPSR